MIRQTILFGNRAHLRFQDVGEREHRVAQLHLIQAMQKVALVLAVVIGLEQLEQPIHFAHLRVMSGRDGICAELHGMVEKRLELDLGIAQDVGVGCASGLVFAQERAEDTLLVFLRKVHRFDGDADRVGDRDRVQQILSRRAILIVVVILPVLHEQADHIIALLLEQQGSDGRIHSVRHADDDARFRIDFHVCPFYCVRGKLDRGNELAR